MNKRSIQSVRWTSGFYCDRVRKFIATGTSLVAQWLRIRLPVQGTWVRSLVREDPTCRRATKPVCHNYRACALESVSHNCWSPRAATTEPTCRNYWARVLQLLKPVHGEPVLHSKRGHRNEKPATPLATARESPCAAAKTQCSQKLKKKFFLIKKPSNLKKKRKFIATVSDSPPHLSLRSYHLSSFNAESKTAVHSSLRRPTSD